MVSNVLGTDILEIRFGRVHPKILFQSPLERVSLMITKNGKVVAYNIVTFEETLYFPKIHAEILSGKSIGKTLRKHNLDVERVEKCMFRYDFPKKLQDIFGSHNCSGFVKYVELLTTLNDKYQLKYATIVEIYSPHIDFIPVKSNKGLVGVVRSILGGHFRGNHD